jgi:hypothetical protein
LNRRRAETVLFWNLPRRALRVWRLAAKKSWMNSRKTQSKSIAISTDVEIFLKSKVR